MTKRIAIILAAFLLITLIAMVGGWKYYSKRLANFQHDSVAKVQAIEDKYNKELKIINDTLLKRDLRIAELLATKAVTERQLTLSSQEASALLQRNKVLKTKKDTIELLANCDSLNIVVQRQIEDMNSYIEQTNVTDSLFKTQLSDKDRLINKKDSLYAEIKASLSKAQTDYSKLYVDHELLKVQVKSVKKTRNALIIGVGAIVAGVLLIK